jgi:SAM-dependent methyltransferase
MSRDDVTGAWQQHGEQWLAWARTPGHDVWFWELNLPEFVSLLPPAGRLTVDIGCGEGRLGRWLNAAGHRVIGIDASPTLATAARTGGGYEEIVCGDATALPWPNDHADLAVAFMSLQDMPDHHAAIAEIARVLEPGGVLCLAITHLLNRPEGALTDYFTEHRGREDVVRNGITMPFEWIDRPLGSYTAALSEAGFVIEHLREPHARPEVVASHPGLAAAATTPFFLHLRCRLSDPAPCGCE